MPTPFYHLSIAQELLGYKAFDQPMKQWLEMQQCAFFFGNTAPDVQVVAGITREDTHFFRLPFESSDSPPWEVFQETFPNIWISSRENEAHLAFLAGYLCHLQADWLWVKDIFAPIFGPTQTWGTFYERLYIHNVLRAYQDRQILEQLPQGIGACLRSVEPQNWLPFVDDKDLLEWRNFLAEQLKPGALPQTVEVFAVRQGISPKEFYSLLNSKERMENEVFKYISNRKIERFRKTLIIENAQLINAFYLSTKS